MSKRRVLTLVAASMLILMSGAGIIHAQSDCGNGLPCGSIPWPQPNPPQLKSPTPIPTITPRPDTNGSIGPGTPTPTLRGSDLGAVDIANQIATASGYNPTARPVLDPSGTPVSISEDLNVLRQNTSVVFGYARGLTNMNFGKTTPLIGFAVFAFGLIMFIKGWTFLMPIVATLVGLFSRLVSFILSFLPI